MEIKGALCPECGAALEQGWTCWDLFGACMEREYVNPAYGAVHHLTVAAYMLQHPSRLSREGWFYMRDLLSQFLLQGVYPEQMRQKIKTVVDSGNRKWRLKGGEPFKGTGPGTWSLTIASLRLEDAQAYSENVKSWAKDVLAKAQKL